VFLWRFYLPDSRNSRDLYASLILCLNFSWSVVVPSISLALLASLWAEWMWKAMAHLLGQRPDRLIRVRIKHRWSTTRVYVCVCLFVWSVSGLINACGHPEGSSSGLLSFIKELCCSACMSSLHFPSHMLFTLTKGLFTERAHTHTHTQQYTDFWLNFSLFRLTVSVVYMRVHIPHSYHFACVWHDQSFLFPCTNCYTFILSY